MWAPVRNKSWLCIYQDSNIRTPCRHAHLSSRCGPTRQCLWLADVCVPVETRETCLLATVPTGRVRQEKLEAHARHESIRLLFFYFYHCHVEGVIHFNEMTFNSCYIIFQRKLQHFWHVCSLFIRILEQVIITWANMVFRGAKETYPRRKIQIVQYAFVYLLLKVVSCEVISRVSREYNLLLSPSGLIFFYLPTIVDGWP